MFKKAIKDAFATLYKNAIIILVIATLSVVLSVGYFSMHTEAKYTARAEVMVHSYTLTELPAGAMVEPEISAMDSALEIFNSRKIFEYLSEAELLSKKLSPEELDKMIEVTRKSKNSLVFYVTVTGEDEDTVLELAEKFPTAMQNVFSTFTGDFYVSTLNIPSDATLSKPATFPIVAVSFVAGALLGVIAVFIFDRMNRRLRSASDYRARYSAPLLGTVPDFSSKKEGN